MQLISIGAQCHLVVSVKPSHALHFHQLLECFQKYFVKWLKVWCCFSLCSVSGPLCAGVVGKKKKKMMYLTTKNAGNFIWALGKMIHYLVIFLFYLIFSCLSLPYYYFLIRIWSSWVADLRGGCQSPALQEEDSGSDRSSGCRPS